MHSTELTSYMIVVFQKKSWCCLYETTGYSHLTRFNHGFRLSFGIRWKATVYQKLVFLITEQFFSEITGI